MVSNYNRNQRYHITSRIYFNLLRKQKNAVLFHYVENKQDHSQRKCKIRCILLGYYYLRIKGAQF